MGGSGKVNVPQDLQQVPEAVLEAYVRSRMLQVAGSHMLADRLRLTPSLVQQAVADVMASEHSHTLQALPSEPSELQLVFRHDCLSLGCLEPGCQLCAQNPHRRCEGNFANKYLAGDVLKAKCGASIRLEVIDRRSGEPLKAGDLEGIQLELCVVDGRAYQGLAESGREQYDDEVDACVLLLNNQQKELLSPGRGGMLAEDKRVVVQMSRGQAHLPDLTVTGSSEAILSGQKPPFRLLVRAIRSQDGTRVSHIRFAVSEAFVVATPRVRTAVKAEIPHIEDHVSKLQAVGVQTQQKLQDIQGAAKGVGIFNLTLPMNKVSKVGEFRELVELAEKDRPLCENLKKVLRLTKGWDMARDHAMQAVGTDNYLRIWYSDATMSNGLLFKCGLGSVDLDAPLGLIQKGGDGVGAAPASMDIILMQQLTPDQKDLARRLQRKAAICWWQHRHPGWTIWHIDSEAYQRGNTNEMRAAMAPGLAPTPTSDAFGAFPSESMNLSGLGSQFGSGLGIPDLARTNRGGSGGMGSGALPGSGYVPPVRGDSGLFNGSGARAFSGLHDIAYRANSETDLGKQVADAQAAGVIGPGSGGSLPHGFGMPGRTSPDLVNANMPEGSSGPLQLNGFDIRGAQGRQPEMQPSRPSDPLPLGAELGLVSYCAPQGSLYSSPGAQNLAPLSMDMPPSTTSLQGMTMGLSHGTHQQQPRQAHQQQQQQQSLPFQEAQRPTAQRHVNWMQPERFTSDSGDMGMRRHSSGKKAQAPLSPFGDLDQQNAPMDHTAPPSTSGRTFQQERPQMGAGHKRRLSEAGLNAVTAIMGRQLTQKEFVRLTSGHWQPEPGLSYNPSGLPFNLSSFNMSGLNSADMQAQIAQDMQQSQPASAAPAAAAAAAGHSQPVLGMPPIPTSPGSGLAGPSISQMFRRDNAAATAPPSLFGAQQPAAPSGQDPALPIRASFMNFDEIDPNALNDAVAMLHDICPEGAAGLDLPRESSAFLDQLYSSRPNLADPGAGNPMPPPPCPRHAGRRPTLLSGTARATTEAGAFRPGFQQGDNDFDVMPRHAACALSSIRGNESMRWQRWLLDAAAEACRPAQNDCCTEASAAPPAELRGLAVKVMNFATDLTTEEQWKSEIEASTGTVQVIEVYQDWCGPCKAIAGTFRRLCFDLGDRPLKFFTANSSKIKVLKEFEGKCEPTFLFYKDGKRVNLIMGVHTGILQQQVDTLSKAAAPQAITAK
ncbi:hypothetical protein WJX74_004575 [Apatococcus lobatus]|uniref:Thioredoxin domain-containing protein n=1 Tax=Apatococcus lobatus TaxID=904363 RepID=A0AAW1Q7Y6_9CHLO